MGSVSVTSKSFEGRYFKFTVSQSGTSTTVNWTFEVIGGTGGLYYSTSPITLKINGVTVKSYSATAWSSYAFPAAKGSVSGTYNIGSYGSFKVLMSGNPNWSTAYDSEGTVTLDRPTYPVYYNTMGGSGTFNAQTKTYGYNLTLHSHKPTKTGYTFQGWATSEGSTTVAYTAGATYTGNARLDLFAVWKADTYAVTYNANGGSGAPTNQTKTYGVTLKLQTGVPTRTNYNFLGWGTSASATTVVYAPGANYTSNTRLDLYAVWELAYVKPRITNLLVDRCDSGGTPTEDGTYAVVAFNWATDRDVTSVKIEWKLSSATSYPSGNSKTVSASGTSGTVNTVVGSGAISADNTYTLKVTVADSIDNSNETRTLSSIEFTLDLLAGGKGAAFGKAAETEDMLEVDWILKANRVIHDRFDTVIPNGLALYTGSEDKAIDPDTTIDELILTDKNLPVNGFRYVRTMFYGTKSPTANRTQIAMPYSGKGSLHYRYYHNGAWSDWDEYINKAALGDFVVERRTNGFWTYEKHNSGKAICYGYNTQNFNCTTASGSLYQGTNNVSWPSGLFTTLHNVKVIAAGSTGPGYSFFGRYVTYTADGYINLLFFSTASASKDITYSIEITGTWK